MKLLTTRSLSRRAALRGIGVTMALPFLEAMRPSVARAQTTAAPKRLMFVYAPCGFDMRTWTPDTTGRSYALSPILSPLEEVRDHLMVISGTRNTPAMDLGDGPGDHARGTGAFLTGMHPLKAEGRVQNGISADQVAANALRGSTRLPSLELGCESGAQVGSCDIGYSCAYSNNISWASSTLPLPKEINPRAVFDRLFESAEAGISEEERAARRRRRSSVIDFVRDDASRLNAKVGARDRVKLDEYLTAVRELERSIEEAPPVQCTLPDRPEGAALDTEQYIRQMMDLVALAWRCDLTRVTTLMIGNGGSNRSYRFLGHPGTHHEYSHHRNDVDKRRALTDIGRFEVAQVAYLAKKLRDIDEGDGTTALDNCAILLSSELEDGDAHSHENMPLIVVGGGGGMLDTGRHVRVDSETEHADVLLTMLRTVGVEQASLGTYGTQTVQDLLA